jgi:hypothetical protein
VVGDVGPLVAQHEVEDQVASIRFVVAADRLV